MCVSERWGELSCPGVHLHLFLQHPRSSRFHWADRKTPWALIRPDSFCMWSIRLITGWHCFSFSQGKPGPRGEKGEKGDQGHKVRWKYLFRFNSSSVTCTYFKFQIWPVNVRGDWTHDYRLRAAAGQRRHVAHKTRHQKKLRVIFKSWNCLIVLSLSSWSEGSFNLGIVAWNIYFQSQSWHLNIFFVTKVKNLNPSRNYQGIYTLFTQSSFIKIKLMSSSCFSVFQGEVGPPGKPGFEGGLGPLGSTGPRGMTMQGKVVGNLLCLVVVTMVHTVLLHCFLSTYKSCIKLTCFLFSYFSI